MSFVIFFVKERNILFFFFFFQAEDGIRDYKVTGVQTCALPIFILLGLLMASDRLFFDLSLGGALIALVVYALRKGWNLVSLSVNWVLSGILGAAGAVSILWFLSSSGI